MQDKACLQYLPPELLEYVVLHLRTADRFAVCCTCKALHKVAQHLLYKKVSLYWIHYPRKVEPSIQAKRLVTLCASLITNPSLAASVQFLNIGAGPWLPSSEDYTIAQGEPAWPDHTLDLSQLTNHKTITEYTTDYGLDPAERTIELCVPSDQQQRWTSQLHTGRMEVLVALALLRCRCVVTVVLDSTLATKPFIIEAMRILLVTSQTIKNLDVARDIFYRQEQSTYSARYPGAEDFISLAALRSLEVVLGPMKFSWTQAPTLNLRELDLRLSAISEEDLGHLLVATPHLRILRFDSSYDLGCSTYPLDSREGRSDINQFFDCAKFDVALQPVQASLELLNVTVQYFDFAAKIRGIGLRGSTGTLKSLCFFPNLRELKLPYHLLLGWEERELELEALLPPRLAVLTIHDSLDCTESWGWDTEALMTALSTCVGVLDANGTEQAKSALNFEFYDAEEPQTLYKYLSTLYWRFESKTNIDCSIHVWGADPDW